MADSQHSPGPWEVREKVEHDCCWDRGVYSATGDLIAETREEDASLIAAALAMKEMIRNLISNIESGSYESTGQCVQEARALLEATERPADG